MHAPAGARRAVPPWLSHLADALDYSSCLSTPLISTKSATTRGNLFAAANYQALIDEHVANPWDGLSASESFFRTGACAQTKGAQTSSRGVLAGTNSEKSELRGVESRLYAFSQMGRHEKMRKTARFFLQKLFSKIVEIIA